MVTFLRAAAAACGGADEDIRTPWVSPRKADRNDCAEEERVRAARYGVKESRTITSSFKSMSAAGLRWQKAVIPSTARPALVRIIKGAADFPNIAEFAGRID